MPRGISGAAWAGLLVVLIAVTPAGARAQEDAEDDLHTLRVVSAVTVALADIGFLAGDLYYGSEGEWMPPYGAWTQLVLMAPVNLALGILTLEYRTDGAWLALGISELVIGTWFAIHGTLSILGQPDEPAPPPERATTAFLVAPLPEGGATAAWATLF